MVFWPCQALITNSTCNKPAEKVRFYTYYLKKAFGLKGFGRGKYAEIRWACNNTGVDTGK